MQAKSVRVGFIGMGHMGMGLCHALIRSHLVPRSQILFIDKDPKRTTALQHELGITASSLEHIAKESDVLLLCVRPSQAEEVLVDLSEKDLQGKCLISIMAGVRLDWIRKLVGSQVGLIRVMPNMCVEVGEGMSLISMGPNVQSDRASFARLLFGSMGHVIEIPEEQMDVGCALVGSGPGFVFSLIEAFARGAEAEGMSYATALKASAQVFLGASKMIQEGKRPDELILRIATPGGTTESGLSLMREEEVGKRIRRVLQASAKRSKELSK